MAVADQDPCIRHYQPGDETAIIGLFATVFSQDMTEAQWRWKYTGTGASPLAKLAFDATGRLVGHAGAIPLRGWRQGQLWPFFQVCDVMVHPEARGRLGEQNLFTRLVRELLTGLTARWPEAFAYGFPGRRPFRLGEYVRVYGKVEQSCTMEQPVRRGFRLRLSARPLDWMDKRLDKLWTRRAHDYALTLIRDRDYLHWRYAIHPSRTYQLFGLYLGTRLLGWAVTQREGERLRVVDLLMHRRWLRLALAALERVATVEGIRTVEIRLPHDWHQAVGQCWTPTEVVVANMIWALSIPTAEVRKTLYYTMGDLDIF